MLMEMKLALQHAEADNAVIDLNQRLIEPLIGIFRDDVGDVEFGDRRIFDIGFDVLGDFCHRLLQGRVADLEVVNRLIEFVIVVIAQEVIKIAAVLHDVEHAVLIAVF